MRSFLAIMLLCSPVAAEELDPDALKRLVHQDCGSCHGLTLKGGLGPDLRVQTLAHYDREGLASIILQGVPGTPMPPWKPLISEEEALWIAEYLLSGESE
jgi:cytochrome c55X